MPAPASRKGKSKVIQDEPITPAMPLGKDLAHTGALSQSYPFPIPLTQGLDKKIRDRAVQSLIAFVNQGDISTFSSGYVQLDTMEMDKLWKGLFYCTLPLSLSSTPPRVKLMERLGFWMSDKPLIQQGLATDMSELLLQINPSGSEKKDGEEGEMERFNAALGFLDGFWRAIVREWAGVDRYR
jgi:ribosomal RNA-processing protein 1